MNPALRNEYLLTVIEGDAPLTISILDDAGAEVGSLRPITKKHLQSSDMIASITSWRNAYKAFFLTQFEATPERTLHWLSKVVLTDPTRMLFLIYTGDTLVGHYGFKDLQGDEVEVDNLLRGERAGHPLLMRYAVSALVRWLFDVIGVRKIHAHVFANNAMALKLHKDLGFTFEGKIPLCKVIDGAETNWTVGRIGETSPDNHYYQKIVIER